MHFSRDSATSSGMILGKSLHLLGPQFLHLESGQNHECPTGGCPVGSNTELCATLLLTLFEESWVHLLGSLMENFWWRELQRRGRQHMPAVGRCVCVNFNVSNKTLCFNCSLSRTTACHKPVISLCLCYLVCLSNETAAAFQ